MTIKAGVIGVGYLGRHHARIYSEIEGVELVGVADPETERAREIASKYGCIAFDDYREMLGHVNAVSIVTPTSLHHSIGLECISSGLDVLIEKPIAVSVEEADSLIEEAGKKNVILQVGHLERYNPAVVEMSMLVKNPVFIESERVAPFHGRGVDVDVTLDLMIHDIDIIMSLLGNTAIRDVRVVGAKVLTDRVDVAKAWIEFENGVTALITASRISKEKLRRLKLFQEESFVVLDYIGMNIKQYYKNGQGIGSRTIDIEAREPLKEEIEDFIRCVRERKRPKVSGEEGKRALEVALDITGVIMGNKS